ncbi:hypothetical protein [Feifania hominis]|uniref:Uncharacterized protein n=1 Tax=Feifania hominis TaxID=2763660 RepID=A0A926DH46_9FIRM|nr:hypothetical protein [Feifania hominis]MBC8537194.1 hypothetical protein [Feifania hominis]
MLGKLIKYDLKSNLRTLFSLYLVLVLMAVALPIAIKWENPYVLGILGVAGSGLVVAIFVILLVFIVEGFNKACFKSQGYLTMTLPVSPEMLVLSKVISVVIWLLCSLAVLFLCGGIVFGLSGLLFPGDLIRFSWGELFEALGRFFQADIIGPLLLSLLQMLVGLVSGVLLIYFCITLSHMGLFRKGRTLTAILSFFALSALTSYLQILVAGVVSGAVPFGDITIETGASVAVTFQRISLGATLFDLAMIVVFFFGTVAIMRRRMELD